MKKNIVKIGKMVYTSMCGCLSKRYRRRHMLTLENLSFGVQDEKSQKEIIRNLNLTIESNKFVVVTGPVSYTHLLVRQRSEALCCILNMQTMVWRLLTERSCAALNTGFKGRVRNAPA